MMNTLKLVAAIALAAAVAFYAGVRYQQGRDEQDYYRTSSVLSAAEAGLCASSLQAIATGRIKLAQTVLETAMKNDVTTALTGSRRMGRLQVPLPSIVEGMTRVAAYAGAHGMRRVAGDATEAARNLAAAGDGFSPPSPRS
jgi:hypothetical protein